MKYIFGILAFFLCLFLYTKFLGPIPFAINSTQTTNSTVFQVSGDGKATAVPNTATISFGVTKQASSVANAQDQTNATIQKILDSLKKVGIQTKDIKTTDYNVNPNYTNSQTINGYTVTQTVEVKITSLDKVNQAIDAVTTSGANIVGQVSFGFDDATMQKLQDEARQDAVNKAKVQAQSLAKASGIHLGNIINVTENQAGTPQPILFKAADQAAGTAVTTAPSQVTPGESSVTITVTLSYQIY